MYLGGGTYSGSRVITRCIILMYQVINSWCIYIYIYIYISFFVHPTVIHKFYVGLTSPNHYFYPDKSWCAMHHLYQCRLEYVICSWIVALSSLDNVAQTSQKKYQRDQWYPYVYPTSANNWNNRQSFIKIRRPHDL